MLEYFEPEVKIMSEMLMLSVILLPVLAGMMIWFFKFSERRYMCVYVVCALAAEAALCTALCFAPEGG